MTRYPTALPDFCRTAWVSDAARDHWLPQIEAIKTLRRRLEVELVYRGRRAAAITDDAPEALTEWIVEAAGRGCVALPLGLSAGGGAYSAVHRAPRPGEAARQRLAIVEAASLAAFRQAWQASDDEAIGALLGFPPCCRAFFRQVWVADHRIDPTWQQAAGAREEAGTIDVPAFAPAANVLGRWIGIRQVAHLPCSFSCAATVAAAADWRQTAEDLSAGALWRDLEAMTRWPAEWSALHGIGQIVTPVWKVIARTDATAERLAIRLYGEEMPAEAAAGLVFPYPRAVDQRDTWTANGFASRASQARAHDTLARAVAAWRPIAGSVLDLGCGSGELVRRLASHRRGGIEAEASRQALAIARDPGGAYICADLRNPEAWPPGPWDLTACMVGRLLEGETAAARAALLGGPVLFYAYTDWLAARSFDALVGEAGMAHRREMARAVSPDATAVILE